MTVISSRHWETAARSVSNTYTQTYTHTYTSSFGFIHTTVVLITFWVTSWLACLQLLDNSIELHTQLCKNMWVCMGLFVCTHQTLQSFNKNELLYTCINYQIPPDLSISHTNPLSSTSIHAHTHIHTPHTHIHTHSDFPLYSSRYKTTLELS